MKSLAAIATLTFLLNACCVAEAALGVSTVDPASRVGIEFNLRSQRRLETRHTAARWARLFAGLSEVPKSATLGMYWLVPSRRGH